MAVQNVEIVFNARNNADRVLDSLQRSTEKVGGSAQKVDRAYERLYEQVQSTRRSERALESLTEKTSILGKVSEASKVSLTKLGEASKSIQEGTIVVYDRFGNSIRVIGEAAASSSQKLGAMLSLLSSAVISNTLKPLDLLAKSLLFVKEVVTTDIGGTTVFDTIAKSSQDSLLELETAAKSVKGVLSSVLGGKALDRQIKESFSRRNFDLEIKTKVNLGNTELEFISLQDQLQRLSRRRQIAESKGDKIASANLANTISGLERQLVLRKQYIDVLEESLRLENANNTTEATTQGFFTKQKETLRSSIEGIVSGGQLSLFEGLTQLKVSPNVAQFLLQSADLLGLSFANRFAGQLVAKKLFGDFLGGGLLNSGIGDQLTNFLGEASLRTVSGATQQSFTQLITDSLTNSLFDSYANAFAKTNQFVERGALKVGQVIGEAFGQKTQKKLNSVLTGTLTAGQSIPTDNIDQLIQELSGGLSSQITPVLATGAFKPFSGAIESNLSQLFSSRKQSVLDILRDPAKLLATLQDFNVAGSKNLPGKLDLNAILFDNVLNNVKKTAQNLFAPFDDPRIIRPLDKFLSVIRRLPLFSDEVLRQLIGFDNIERQWPKLVDIAYDRLNEALASRAETFSKERKQILSRLEEIDRDREFGDPSAIAPVVAEKDNNQQNLDFVEKRIQEAKNQIRDLLVEANFDGGTELKLFEELALQAQANLSIVEQEINSVSNTIDQLSGKSRLPDLTRPTDAIDIIDRLDRFQSQPIPDDTFRSLADIDSQIRQLQGSNDSLAVEKTNNLLKQQQQILDDIVSNYRFIGQLQNNRFGGNVDIGAITAEVNVKELEKYRDNWNDSNEAINKNNADVDRLEKKVEQFNKRIDTLRQSALSNSSIAGQLRASGLTQAADDLENIALQDLEKVKKLENARTKTQAALDQARINRQSAVDQRTELESEANSRVVTVGNAPQNLAINEQALNRLKEYRALFNSVPSQIAASETQVIKLQNRLTALQQIAENLRSTGVAPDNAKLVKTEALIARVSNRINDLRFEAFEAKESLDQAFSSLEETFKEALDINISDTDASSIAALEKQLESLREKQASAIKEIEDAQKQISAGGDGRQEASIKGRIALIEELNNLQSTPISKEDQRALVEIDAQLKNLRDNGGKIKLDGLVAQLENVQKEISPLEAEINRLSEVREKLALKTATGEINPKFLVETERRIASLQSRLEPLQKEFETIAGAIEDEELTRGFTGVDPETSKKSNALLQKQKEILDRVAESYRRIASIQQQLGLEANLDIQADFNQAELDRYRRTWSVITEEIDKSNTEINRLEKNLEELNKRASEIQEKGFLLDVDELSKVNQQINATTSEIERLTEGRDKTTQRREQLETDTAPRIVEVANRPQNVAINQVGLDELKVYGELIEAATRKVAKNESKVATLEQRLSKLQQRSAQLKASGIVPDDPRIQKLDKAIASVNDRITDTRKNLLQSQEEARAITSTFNALVAGAIDLSRASVSAIIDPNAKNAVLALQEELSNLEKQQNDLTESILRNQEEIDRRERSGQSAAAASQEEANLRSRLTDIDGEFQRGTQEIDLTKQQVTGVESILSGKLGKKDKKRFDELKAQSAAVASEIAKTQESFFKGTIGSQDFRATTQRLQVELAKIESQIDQVLTKPNEKARKEITKLTKEFEKLNEAREKVVLGVQLGDVDPEDAAKLDAELASQQEQIGKRINRVAANSGLELEESLSGWKKQLQELEAQRNKFLFGTSFDQVRTSIKGFVGDLEKIAGVTEGTFTDLASSVAGAAARIDGVFGGLLSKSFTQLGATATRSFASGFLSGFYDQVLGPAVNFFDRFIGETVNKLSAIPDTISSGLENVQQVGFVFSGLSEPFELFEELNGQIFQAVEGLEALSFRLFAFQQIGFALQSFVQSGPFALLINQNIELRDQLLATQASLASTTTPVTPTGTKISDPLVAIKAYEGIVASTLAGIRQDSLELVGVVSSDLVDLFQIVSQNIAQVGGGLDDARKLVVSFAGSLGTLNIPLFQARQEISSILQGTIDQNSVLAKTIGLTNTQVQQWVSQGTAVENLLKKLQAFREANKIGADTIRGISSNIQEVVENIGLAAGGGLLNPIVDRMRAIFEFLTEETTSSTGDTIRVARSDITKFITEIVEKISNKLQKLADAVGRAFQVMTSTLVGTVSFGVKALESLFDGIANGLNISSSILEPFFNVLGALAQEANAPLVLFVQIIAVSTILQGAIGLLTLGFKAFSQALPVASELMFLFKLRSTELLKTFGSLVPLVGTGVAGFTVLATNLQNIPGLAAGASAALAPFLGGFTALAVGLIPAIGGITNQLLQLISILPGGKQALQGFLSLPITDVLDVASKKIGDISKPTPKISIPGAKPVQNPLGDLISQVPILGTILGASGATLGAFSGKIKQTGENLSIAEFATDRFREATEAAIVSLKQGVARFFTLATAALLVVNVIDKLILGNQGLTETIKDTFAVIGNAISSTIRWISDLFGVTGRLIAQTGLLGQAFLTLAGALVLVTVRTRIQLDLFFALSFATKGLGLALGLLNSALLFIGVSAGAASLAKLQQAINLLTISLLNGKRVSLAFALTMKALQAAFLPLAVTIGVLTVAFVALNQVINITRKAELEAARIAGEEAQKRLNLLDLEIARYNRLIEQKNQLANQGQTPPISLENAMQESGASLVEQRKRLLEDIKNQEARLNPDKRRAQLKAEIEQLEKIGQLSSGGAASEGVNASRTNRQLRGAMEPPAPPQQPSPEFNSEIGKVDAFIPQLQALSDQYADLEKSRATVEQQPGVQLEDVKQFQDWKKNSEQVVKGLKEIENATDNEAVKKYVSEVLKSYGELQKIRRDKSAFGPQDTQFLVKTQEEDAASKRLSLLLERGGAVREEIAKLRNEFNNLSGPVTGEAKEKEEQQLENYEKSLENVDKAISNLKAQSLDVPRRGTFFEQLRRDLEAEEKFFREGRGDEATFRSRTERYIGLIGESVQAGFISLSSAEQRLQKIGASGLVVREVLAKAWQSLTQTVEQETQAQTQAYETSIAELKRDQSFGRISDLDAIEQIGDLQTADINQQIAATERLIGLRVKFLKSQGVGKEGIEKRLSGEIVDTELRNLQSKLRNLAVKRDETELAIYDQLGEEIARISDLKTKEIDIEKKRLELLEKAGKISGTEKLKQNALLEEESLKEQISKTERLIQLRFKALNATTKEEQKLVAANDEKIRELALERQSLNLALNQLQIETQIALKLREIERNKQRLVNTQQGLINALNAATFKYESQEKLLSKQKDVVSSISELFNSEIDVQVAGIESVTAGETSELRRKQLAELTAAIKLDALTKEQQIALQNLDIETKLTELALQRQEIANNIAIAEGRSGLAEAQANLATAKANFESPDKIQALELQVQARQIGLDSRIQEKGLIAQERQATLYVQSLKGQVLLNQQQAALIRGITELNNASPNQFLGRRRNQDLTNSILPQIFGVQSLDEFRGMTTEFINNIRGSIGSGLPLNRGNSMQMGKRVIPLTDAQQAALDSPEQRALIEKEKAQLAQKIAEFNKTNPSGFLNQDLVNSIMKTFAGGDTQQTPPLTTGFSQPSPMLERLTATDGFLGNFFDALRPEDQGLAMREALKRQRKLYGNSLFDQRLFEGGISRKSPVAPPVNILPDGSIISVAKGAESKGNNNLNNPSSLRPVIVLPDGSIVNPKKEPPPLPSVPFLQPSVASLPTTNAGIVPNSSLPIPRFDMPSPSSLEQTATSILEAVRSIGKTLVSMSADKGKSDVTYNINVDGKKTTAKQTANSEPTVKEVLRIARQLS